MKRALLWFGVVVVIGLVVWGLAKLSGPMPTSQTAIVLAAVSENDWVGSNKGAQITLIEYSDFQCPACAAYHPLIKRLIAEQGDKFRFVYRHFPLSQHLNAKPTAYAAEAAGRQGQFWEMHDLIFERQTEWAKANNADELLLGYATTLGLIIDQFTSDYRSSAVRDKVEADFQSGLSAGVNSTPTFFLNGRRIQPRNYQEFVELIQQADVTNS